MRNTDRDSSSSSAALFISSQLQSRPRTTKRTFRVIVIYIYFSSQRINIFALSRSTSRILKMVSNLGTLPPLFGSTYCVQRNPSLFLPHSIATGQAINVRYVFPRHGQQREITNRQWLVFWQQHGHIFVVCSAYNRASLY